MTLTTHACLTLLLPASMEDPVIDWLIGLDALAIEFSVHAVAARGPLVRLSATDEQVRGFAPRSEFKLILPAALIDGLLHDLTPLMRGHTWGHWVMPVQQLAVHQADDTAVPA